MLFVLFVIAVSAKRVYWLNANHEYAFSVTFWNYKYAQDCDRFIHQVLLKTEHYGIGENTPLGFAQGGAIRIHVKSYQSSEMFTFGFIGETYYSLDYWKMDNNNSNPAPVIFDILAQAMEDQIAIQPVGPEEPAGNILVLLLVIFGSISLVMGSGCLLCKWSRKRREDAYNGLEGIVPQL